MAIGESTTADRLSWFEILRHVLATRREVVFVNLAVSGHTTTQALTRLPALGFHRPDHVLCMLGANDAQRLRPDGPTLVDRGETERNLVILRELAGDVRWTWLTPSTVDEERVRGYVHFQRQGISWVGKDIDAVAEFLHLRPEPTIDTRPATSGPGRHLEDGVHLTLDGQREVAAAVVAGLAGE